MYPFPPEDIFVDIAIPTGKSLLHLCFVLEPMTLLSSLTLPCVVYDFNHSSLEHSASYEYSSALDAIFMDVVVRTGAILFCFCYLTKLLSCEMFPLLFFLLQTNSKEHSISYTHSSRLDDIFVYVAVSTGEEFDPPKSSF